MARIDEIKELIGLLKAGILVLLAIDSSLIAWLFKYPSLNVKSYIVISAVLVTTSLLVISLKYILKEIRKLRDL